MSRLSGLSKKPSKRWAFLRARPVGKAVRKAAEGQPCALRLNGCELTGTTVLAHIRTTGTGAGKKPSDSMGVFACAKCHDVIDGRRSSGMMPKEIQERIIKGLAETHDYLIDQGLLVLR